MVGRALVRPPGDSFRHAIRRVPAPIDPERARAQHAAYVEGLRWLGFEVVALPADERFPDGCFVEDQAVIVGDRAVSARSGHPDRRAEAETVAAALRASGVGVTTLDDGVLDGGDVLRVGSTLLVGDSGRTDAAGRRALARAFPELEVRRVAVAADTLHLKCLCSCPVDGLLVVAEGAFPAEAFAGLPVARLTIPAEEAWAANLVGEGRRVLVGEGHPRTAALLAERGLEPRLVPADAFRAADGSLTCLSLLLRP